jgi:lipopolysaccharide export system protein LptA
MITSAKIGFLIIFLQVSFISFGQVVPPKADTVKEFEILKGPSMRSINIDSVTTLQTIAGGAVIRQGTTIFSSDSVAINPATHIVEAFGNVHINQADSVQTYAQYLKYIGTEKTAYLKKDVRLNDKKATVYTQDLDYNLGTGIGNYHNGGKVINGKTTITSTDGIYYADTKDIYFKNNVVVVEPKSRITTDSLLYNMRSQGSNFTGDTYIKNAEVDIRTTQGTHDFATGNTLFTSRTTVRDSSGKIYVANNMALDDKSGNAQLEGNAIVKDSANGFTVLANQVFLNKKSNSFLATRKPVLIIKQNSDSIYIAADTIFSGFSNAVKNDNFILKKDTVIQDTVSEKLKMDSANVTDTIHKIDSLHNPKLKIQNAKDVHADEKAGMDSAAIRKPPLVTVDSTLTRPPGTNNRKDSLHNNLKDSAKVPPALKDSGQAQTVTKRSNRLARLNKNPLPPIPKPEPARADSATSAATVNTVTPADTSRPVAKDTLNRVGAAPDTGAAKSNVKMAASLDSLQKTQKDSLEKPDSAVRHFLAFHHVRIFSDSLQSVCDSLFFSAKDSVFRLYYDPVIWSGRSQITGDTIFLYTKNKKAERLYVFERGMIINKTREGFYNQIAGKTINGYFVDGAIDYMRVRGSQSESIYYAQDQDSAYVGMNRATGDVIDLYFKNDDLKKVLFVNDIKGRMYPMKQIPEDQKYLKNFIWLQDKRPKTRLELFE